MPVVPGERSVLAYFSSSSGAKEAAEELRDIGYDTVQVERISHYGSGEEAGGAALGRMTMFSSEDDSPGETSMVTNGGGGPPAGGGGRAFLVTVLTGEGNAGQVEGILEKHGGRI